jgi:acetyl-CoA acetyltransferase
MSIGPKVSLSLGRTLRFAASELITHGESGRSGVGREDVLNSRMIAYPFRLLQCCLVTDGGGALILVSADRAKDIPQKPVYLLGTGESVETPMVSQMEDFTSSRAFRVAGPKAFAEAGITHKDVDHLTIYDAFAHLPIYGLEDLGFVPRGEAGRFIAERNTAPGGKLPLNTNGGGLSYMHSGMYGMYALQESVRQMRGVAPAQIPDAKISVCHGVGGMFAREQAHRDGQIAGCAALEGEKCYTCGEGAPHLRDFYPQSPRIREMSANVIRLF